MWVLAFIFVHQVFAYLCTNNGVPSPSPDDAIIELVYNNFHPDEVNQIYCSMVDGALRVTNVVMWSRVQGTLVSEIGLLPYLRGLELIGWQTEGKFPTEIGNLKQLDYIHLFMPKITGTIATEIGMLTSLEIVQFRYMRLTGTIPTEIGRLTKLSYMLELTDMTITGTVPTEIGNLINLSALHLDSLAVTGTIPTEIYRIPTLKELTVKNSKLSGGCLKFSHSVKCNVDYSFDCSCYQPPCENICSSAKTNCLCERGYFDGTFSGCESKCNSCNGGTQYNCTSGFYRSGETCLGGGTDTQTCKICSDSGSSYSCPEGYKRYGEACSGTGWQDTQSCVPCAHNGKLYVCKTGFYRDGEVCKGMSHQDTQTCRSCIDECAQGFYLNGKICTGLTYSDSRTCQACSHGPLYDCGYGSFRSGEFCSGRTTNDTQTCEDCITSCPIGYFKQGKPCNGTGFEDTQKCSPCPLANDCHVSVCTSDASSMCVKCNKGFEPDVDGICVPASQEKVNQIYVLDVIIAAHASCLLFMMIYFVFTFYHSERPWWQLLKEILYRQKTYEKIINVTMFVSLIVSLILAILSQQEIIDMDWKGAYETIITVLVLSLQLISTVSFAKTVNVASQEESSELLYGMTSAESLSFSASEDDQARNRGIQLGL